MNGAVLGGWVPHIADVKHGLNLENHVLGLALLASAIGAVSAMQFGGYLIQRLSSRRTLLLAGSGLVVMVPLLVAAPSLTLFVLTLFGYGAMNGLMDLSMNAHAMAVQEQFDRPIVSAVHGWFCVGGFAGALGASMSGRLNAPPLYHLLLASAVLGCLLHLTRRYLLPASADQAAEHTPYAFPFKGPHGGQLLILGMMVAISFMTEGALWDWLSLYLRVNLHATASVGAAGFGFASVMMALGRFLGDSLVHRWGDAWVIGVSSVMAVIGYIAMVLAPNVPLAVVSAGVAGLGLANLVPILFRAAGSMRGLAAGIGLAGVATCGYGGFLFGPPLVGFIADARNLSFALGCMGALIGVVAIWGPKSVSPGPGKSSSFSR